MAPTSNYSFTKPSASWLDQHPGQGPAEMLAAALDDIDTKIALITKGATGSTGSTGATGPTGPTGP